MGRLTHPACAAVAAACLGAACLPGLPARPEVDMPPIERPRPARIVARIGPEAGLTDVRAMRATLPPLRLLVVGDATGLFVFDVLDPAAPGPRGSLPGPAVDRVAVGSVYAHAATVGGAAVRMARIEPGAPTQVREIASPTATFGGIAALGGLVWHAHGSITPSTVRLFQGTRLRGEIEAPDRERGSMDAWLWARPRRPFAVVSVHFDDFAGDGLDGNGAFGFALFRADSTEAGLVFRTAGTILSPEHDYNRSTHERGANSDLQADFDGDHLYLTGEQRLRVFALDRELRADELGSLDLPDVLDVAVDAGAPDGPVVALANGDLLIVDASEPARPRLSAVVETPGVARVVAAAGDGAHFFVGDGDGVAVVRVEAP